MKLKPDAEKRRELQELLEYEGYTTRNARKLVSDLFKYGKLELAEKMLQTLRKNLLESALRGRS